MNEIINSLPETELKKQASILAKHLSKSANRLKKTTSLLNKFTKSKNNDLNLISETISQLQGEWENLAPENSIRTIHENLTKLQAQLRQNAHHNLLKALNEAATPNMKLKVLSDNPLTCYLHPLTVTADFERQKTILSYAKETIAESTLNVDTLFQDHEKALNEFRRLRIDSKTFITLLYKAYKMLTIKNNIPPDKHVDIVELIQPLSWIHPAINQISKKTLPLLPKYILAYQLQKLRTDKCLEINNAKLNLGTATGASTKNKNSVLFIPFTDTEGQYYLSLAFTPN